MNDNVSLLQYLSETPMNRQKSNAGAMRPRVGYNPQPAGQGMQLGSPGAGAPSAQRGSAQNRMMPGMQRTRMRNTGGGEGAQNQNQNQMQQGWPQPQVVAPGTQGQQLGQGTGDLFRNLPIIMFITQLLQKLGLGGGGPGMQTGWPETPPAPGGMGGANVANSGGTNPLMAAILQSLQNRGTTPSPWGG